MIRESIDSNVFRSMIIFYGWRSFSSLKSGGYTEIVVCDTVQSDRPAA